MQAKLMLYFAS